MDPLLLDPLPLDPMRLDPLTLDQLSLRVLSEVLAFVVPKRSFSLVARSSLKVQLHAFHETEKKLNAKDLITFMSPLI